MDCDVVRGKLKAYRIKETVKSVSNVYELPVAQRRKERVLEGEDFCAPDAEEVIEDDNKDKVTEPVVGLVLPDGLPPALK